MVGNPSLAIDGDNGTLWHTWYATPHGGGKKGNNHLPHSLILSLGKSVASVALATCHVQEPMVLCQMATSRAMNSISQTTNKMDAR